MSNKQEPRAIAYKKCAKWLAYCLDIGWDKSSIDGLEKLWWEHHDHNGNFVKSESKLTPPSVEQDIEREVNHIFESGANEIRGVIELIKRLVYRKGQAPSVDGELLALLKDLRKNAISGEYYCRITDELITRMEGSAPQEEQPSLLLQAANEEIKELKRQLAFYADKNQNQ